MKHNKYCSYRSTIYQKVELFYVRLIVQINAKRSIQFSVMLTE